MQAKDRAGRGKDRPPPGLKGGRKYRFAPHPHAMAGFSFSANFFHFQKETRSFFPLIMDRYVCVCVGGGGGGRPTSIFEPVW